MSTVMSPELLAQINACFSTGQWRTVGVHVDEHPEANGEGWVMHRTATLQVEHAAAEKLLVFTLEGHDGYTSAKLMAGGGSFTTTDATLIARLAASIAPASAAMQTALIADLAGTL